ncbi:MAG: alpha/beta hydrolase-fold protein [Vicinamibacterales bacterium]
MVKRSLPVLVVLAGVLAATSFLGAQQPVPQTPPAAPAAAGPPAPGGRGGGRGGAPVKSPEIAADGRVTFRLRAPNAKEVLAVIGGNRLPMVKDEQGVWSVTSDPLKPDYYTYSLSVDGTTINDPSNRQAQTSFGNFQSMFVVAGPQPWLPTPGVPRGVVAKHTFHSAVANDDREFYVYTPPGYEAKRARPYPILYLLHGLGDDAERWMNFGGAPYIFDNLIAAGKAVPMVVVTTLGYGVGNGPAGAMAAENITGYTKSLLTEVMPTVERAYNVSRERETRAIAGLSMGGAETLYTGLNNLDKFAWMASFSGAFVMWPNDNRAPRGDGAGARAGAAPAAGRGDGAAAGPGAAAGGRGGRGGGQALDVSVFEKNFPTLSAKDNSRIRMLWITVGTADGLLGVNRQFKEWLKTKNVRFTELEVEDMAHVWPLWRDNLTTFAQQVFQPAR